MNKLRSIGIAVILIGMVIAGRTLWPIGCAFAAPVINTGQVSQYVGKNVTVQGTVAQVHVSRKGHVYLNFDGRYPHNSFTGVIFRDHVAALGDISGLQGRLIRVTGKIRKYRGKPEIMINQRSQIQVVR